MKIYEKRLPALIALLLAATLSLSAFCGCAPKNDGPAEEATEGPTAEPTEDPNAPKLLAHWKLQNQEGCFTGSVDDDQIGFKDLSGNGNDLIMKTVGNGDQLDIFSWDTDIDASEVRFTSALKMDNTKAKAKTVDPYKASQTSYTGGYTSVKFLETVKGAPLNSFEFTGGASVEVIFKLSPELDNDYNRYTGIFSRQGVLEDQNEPPFSIALSEWVNDDSGTLGANETWIQLLLTDDYTSLNRELDEVMLPAGVWHHALFTLQEGKVRLYMDGKLLLDERTGFYDIFCTNPDYSWEVGVGRKFGGGHASDSKNEDAAEGMIRRLFAGSVAEIRVFDKAIELNDSLYAAEFVKK